MERPSYRLQFLTVENPDSDAKPAYEAIITSINRTFDLNYVNRFEMTRALVDLYSEIWKEADVTAALGCKSRSCNQFDPFEREEFALVTSSWNNGSAPDFWFIRKDNDPEYFPILESLRGDIGSPGRPGHPGRPGFKGPK